MNCQGSQRLLLQTEDPAAPPGAVQAHLADCPACRAWQRRLLRLEETVPGLPVPPSSARDHLVQRILMAPPPAERGSRIEEPKERVLEEGRPAAGLELRSGLRNPRTRERIRLGLAGLAAALVVALSWWVLWRPGPHTGPVAKKSAPPPDPLVAQLVQRDLVLADARTPRQRVEGLADLAGDLEAETRKLIRGSGVEDLVDLARLYQEVVRDGVVKQARTLPPEERALVLGPIGDRLARTGHEAETLAQDVPAAADPLRLIAEAARAGGRQLRPDTAGGPAPAEVTTPPPADDRRLHQLHRNRGLIQSLVDGGLHLADAEDALKRADCCNRLAESLAGEIRQAAQSKDGPRAAELGRHFQAILVRGVATNLTVARSQIPPGSSQEKELRDLGRRVGNMIQPVEEQLEEARPRDPEDMGHALQAVKGGWEEVEKALPDPGRPPDPKRPD